jgi:hypothetical protein
MRGRAHACATGAPGHERRSATARAYGRSTDRTRENERVRENDRMSVTRIAWLATVLVALLTGLLLLLSGYNGYAGLGLAVAIAAAINLL